jgi:hypothetical protein
MQAVHEDVVHSEFGRESPCQAGDRVLARRVVHHERLDLHSCGGSDEDDGATTASLDKVWRSGHHRVPRADDVGVDRLAERLIRDLVPGCGTADSGVGDDDVESALPDAAVDPARSIPRSRIDRPREHGACSQRRSGRPGQIIRGRRAWGTLAGSGPAMSTDIGALGAQSLGVRPAGPAQRLSRARPADQPFGH